MTFAAVDSMPDSGLLAAWKQVLVWNLEEQSDRNVARMLTDTDVPVQPDDQRRLDLLEPGSNVHCGLFFLSAASL